MTPDDINEATMQLIRTQVKRMRTASIVVFAALAAAALVGFKLPRLHNDMLGPQGVTLVAAAAALWVGFTANRDARLRLEKIKRAHAVHGEVRRLLRDFLLVYVIVLVRISVVAGCGLAVASFGAGPGLGAAFIGLAAVLNLMAWPTEHKTRLLIRRAEALRP